MSDLNLKNLSAVQTDNLTVEFGERPKMAALDGVTHEHRRAGAHLAAIHRMHLHDMNRMGAFLEHLKQGKMTPAEFSNRIKDSELSKKFKNVWNTMWSRVSGFEFPSRCRRTDDLS